MIHSLPDRLRALLLEGLADLISAPDQQVAERAPDDFAGQTLPLLVVRTASLQFNQQIREPGAGQPALQERGQEFSVKSTSPTGPYKLLQQPLAGSLRCLLRDPDGATRLLVAGADLSYDPRLLKLTLTQAPAVGSVLLARYAVAVAELTKIFEQRLLLDIYAEDMAQLEQWSALALAALLTNQERLLAPTTPESYLSGAYSARQTIEQLELVELVPAQPGAISHAQIALRALGRLALARAVDEGAGVIAHVRSAGRSGDAAVDIDVRLDSEG